MDEEAREIEAETAETKDVGEHAHAHGLLPRELPGDRRRPIIINQKSWRLAAVMRAEGWTEQTQIHENTFLAALAKLDAGLIR